jgi:hypothetical protein
MASIVEALEAERMAQEGRFAPQKQQMEMQQFLQNQAMQRQQMQQTSQQQQMQMQEAQRQRALEEAARRQSSEGAMATMNYLKNPEMLPAQQDTRMGFPATNPSGYGPDVKGVPVMKPPEMAPMTLQTVANSIMKNNPKISPEGFLAALKQFEPRFAEAERAKLATIRATHGGAGGGGVMGAIINKLQLPVEQGGEGLSFEQALNRAEQFKRSTGIAGTELTPQGEIAQRKGGKEGLVTAEEAKAMGKANVAAKEEAEKGRGQNAAKIEDEINTQADAASLGNVYLQHAEELSKDFTPGKLAPLKTELGSWLVAMGMDQDDVDKKLGSAGSAQALVKTILPLVTQSVRQISSRPAQMEWLAFVKANPNIELTPDGMQKVISFTRRMNDLNIERQQAFQQWKVGKPDNSYGDFSTEWNKTLAQRQVDSRKQALQQPTATPQAPQEAPQVMDFNSLPE